MISSRAIYSPPDRVADQEIFGLEKKTLPHSMHAEVEIVQIILENDMKYIFLNFGTNFY